MTTRYPIRIGDRSRLFLRIAFGVTPQRAFAEIDDEDVHVRFGRFAFTAPLATVTGWRIEGPWAWITAIGVRMNVFKRDVSFCGSPRGGVRLEFTPAVRWGRLRILAAYYGVEDLDGFAAAIGARGIPGEDVRRP
jgi:hypothetical protein